MIVFIEIDPMGKVNLFDAGYAGLGWTLEMGGGIQNSLLSPNLGSYCLMLPSSLLNDHACCYLTLGHLDGTLGM